MEIEFLCRGRGSSADILAKPRKRVSEKNERGFLFRREPRGAETEAVSRRVASRAAAFLQHALGEGARRFDVGDIVQRHERVQRGIRASRLHGAMLAVGHVEEQRRPDDAPPEDIQAAPIKRFAVVLFVT